jgi:hypothetical protein
MDVNPQDQDRVNAVLLDRSERMEKALFGNGDPESGLLAVVATHGEAIEGLQDWLAETRVELRERTPSVREKQGLMASGAAGLLALVTIVVKAFFPGLNVGG